MIVNKFSKIGSYHKASNQENQDYVCSINTKKFLVIMLADGATACRMGREGARVSCEAMAQVVEQEGSVFFSYAKEKIAYLLTEHILYCLECSLRAECEKARKSEAEQCDIHEYGSTFALAFIEKKTGRTVLVNLGDGAVISLKEDRISYLLKPRRFRGNPCLTTTKGADKAIEIQVVNVAFGDSILLCSDGFLDVWKNAEIVDGLKKQNMEAVNQMLEQADNADDCSYIAFTRERIEREEL